MDPRLTVTMTRTMGRGVLARAPIAAGSPLGRFHTIRIPPDEVARMKHGTLSRFWFEDERDGAAFIVLGVIELINHSLEPNVDRRWSASEEGEMVELYALRDIAAGEQLFLDYRFDGAASDPAWARTASIM